MFGSLPNFPYLVPKSFIEMARKKPIVKETLSTPRRRSPRFLPHNSPQQFTKNPSKSNPISHSSTPKSQVFSNKSTKWKISPVKLRRSFRLREVKEKKGYTENVTDGQICSGFDGNLSGYSRRRVAVKVGKNAELGSGILCEVVKRVTRSGGIRNGSQIGEEIGNLGFNRGKNRCEDRDKLERNGNVDCNRGESRGRGGCKYAKFRRVEESTLVAKRVTRSGSFRNGGKCERSGSVDCNRGLNWGRGGCKDDKFRRVEESTVIAKRVTRSGGFRNGGKCERSGSVDCKEGGNCVLSEVLEGDGFKDEKFKMVDEGSTRIAKRITRSVVHRNGSEYEERNGNVDCNAGDKRSLSEDMDGGGFKDEKLKRVVEESTLIAKRVTRSASFRNGGGYDKRNGNADCDAGDSRPLFEDVDEGVEESSLGNAKEENVGNKKIGQKRKKNQQKGECGCSNGWTHEQEVALQKAYFAVKPTPHFWNKVAKMVPGKSAQDCFDRIHSDQKTPQIRKLSRAKRATPSSLSFTASKLLDSTTKGPRKSKFNNRNRHLAQKTVRQLLQKQVHVNKDGADLFAILEKTVDSSNGFSQHCTPCSTPNQKQKGLNFLNVCQETLSTAHRKQLSRFSSSSGASLTSPPVLKHIKNMALHEKYIDQLHCREAKRRATVARFEKQVKNSTQENRVHGENIEAVKAARNALFLDATEAINQFQQSQKGAVDSWDLCDDEMPCSDEDE